MSLEVNKLRAQLRDVEERCVDAYAQQRLTPWIRRIKLRRKSGDQCLKMTWGEVKFADHIRELQSERTDLPPQPSYIRQHILHHDVQRTVLGESPYIHADLML
ncbi:Oidioi.mRNA.OKI2018_I69.chr1.g2111.t3.cds [Oikopleura dioica]|nr:Oidioi.mRNA.OKI2018_I69.chr1.g2111.t3.cds [Oikopleura dioica]